MPRRWSVAGQLLALQLGIIAVVLVGVGAVTLAQAQISFRQTQGARVMSVAENLAARPLLRQRSTPPSRAWAARTRFAGSSASASRR